MMKVYSWFCYVLSIVVISSCGNVSSESTSPSKVEEKLEITYDSLLAKSYGADDYGMKTYVIAYLLEGPKRDQDSLRTFQIQRAHLDNINKMASEGKLVLAGPFIEETYPVRGIYVFNTSSMEEAQEWTNSDPAVQAGRLIMELHPWYASAALVGINDMHKRISKVNI